MPERESVCTVTILGIFCTGLACLAMAVAAALLIFTDMSTSDALGLSLASAIAAPVVIGLIVICMCSPLLIWILCMTAISVLLGKYLPFIFLKRMRIDQ